MKRFVMALCAVIVLAGCSPATGAGGGGLTDSSLEDKRTLALQKAIRTKADYWQRSDAVSAQYLTGPKAQHELNQDIAACVAEVRELVRLGSIKKAMPPQGVGMEAGMGAGWNSVTRDGPLYTEYTDFQDFEGCMRSKGWERTDFVRPVVAQQSSANYVSTILGRTFGWTPAPGTYNPDDTSNFNR